MNLAVTTSVQQLDTSDYPDTGQSGQRIRLQNLGAGVVYVDYADDVSASTGFKMIANAELELPWSPDLELYVIGSAAADLRFIVAG